MAYLKNPWVALAIGIIIGGTLLKNRVASLPLVSKIPSI